jgi:hypothetical protein
MGMVAVRVVAPTSTADTNSCATLLASLQVMLAPFDRSVSRTSTASEKAVAHMGDKVGAGVSDRPWAQST